MSAPSERALSQHAASCQRGDDGYMDPDSGLFVMTSAYLRSRGWCCGKACRHCPWDPTEQTRAGRPPAPAWPWPAPRSAS